MTDYTAQARKIIRDNIYCTIATSSKGGKPWISPVFYGFDDDFTIYWVSSKNALHSRLIRANPQVAIVIFNSQAPEGEGDGVYIEATVLELSNLDEVKRAVSLIDMRVTVEEFRVKNLKEVTGDGVWRVYKAVPESISKLTKGEYINGQYVDKRVSVDMGKR